MTLFQHRINAAILRAVTKALENGWEVLGRKRGSHTIGDFISAVFSVETLDEAKEFYAGYLVYLKPLDRTESEENVAQSNIGWCFGEGMSDEKIALWKSAIAGIEHPIFGATMPSAEEVYRLAQQAASRK